MYLGTLDQGNLRVVNYVPSGTEVLAAYPCQIAKQIVIAGLKCPPDVGPQTMIAKAIPIAYAQPIWNNEPNTGSVLLRKNEACEAIPG